MIYRAREFLCGRAYVHKRKYVGFHDHKTHHAHIARRRQYYKNNFTIQELQYEQIYVRHKLAAYEQNVGPLYWYIISIFFTATMTFMYHVPKKIEDKLIYQVVDHMIEQEGNRIAMLLLRDNRVGLEKIIESLENMQDIELFYEGTVYKLFYLGLDIILVVFFMVLTSLIAYSFLNGRRVASLKFNLLVIQDVLEEEEDPKPAPCPVEQPKIETQPLNTITQKPYHPEDQPPPERFPLDQNNKK